MHINSLDLLVCTIQSLLHGLQKLVQLGKACLAREVFRACKKERSKRRKGSAQNHLGARDLQDLQLQLIASNTLQFGHSFYQMLFPPTSLHINCSPQLYFSHSQPHYNIGHPQHVIHLPEQASISRPEPHS